MGSSHALSVQLQKWREEVLNEAVVEKSVTNHPEFLLAVLDGIRETDNIQKVTVGLSTLVCRFPVAARFAIQYFNKLGSPLETLGENLQSLKLDEPVSKRRKTNRGVSSNSRNENDLLRLLKAVLIILQKLPKRVFTKWSIDDFMRFKSHTSKEIKWLAVQCLSRLLDLSDVENSILVSNFELSEDDCVTFSVAFHDELCKLSYPVTPVSNLTNEYFPANGILQVTPNLDLLSVGGIIVKSIKPLDPSQQQPFESLNIVPLPSVLNNVKKILLQVQSGIPVCVSGPIGVGKTSLLRFTASICGRNYYPDIVTVQMSDQIDSRLLLGSYHSTDLPGQFVWKAGCLTKAILDGHWIIFEDIDSAPIDVITLLDAINDTNQVEVPGYGQITQFHTDFRMFCTVRTAGKNKSLEKWCKSWFSMHVNTFLSEELVVVINQLFPHLSPIVDRIIDIFNSIVNSQLPIKRLISVRDLMKFCHRLPKDLDFSSTVSAIAIFQEACDVFVSPLSNLDEKLILGELIGTHLNLLPSKVEYFLTMNKPSVLLSGNTNTLTSGRFTLPMAMLQPGMKREDIGVYSLTKRACTLLESISGAVYNKEPILLIGETGVGKTSCVQYLAKMLQQKMLVVNLNRQSDSSDLLGGYKPVELKYIFSPLREEFETLFDVSFDKQANNKFMNHIMTCFGNHRWGDLLKLMSHVQKSASLKPKMDPKIRDRWKLIGHQISRIDSQINDRSESPFAFSFIEGTLIEAIKNGHWILLDEINLATSEMLQCLAGVLDKQSGIHLWEKGDEQPIERHANFQLFAAMNPSTDIGKKDLPVGIRNRFTEFYVDELTDEDELRVLVSDYLAELSLPNEQINSIVEFYSKVKQLAATSLIDGMGKRPHFSLRTLCRALKISSFNLYGSVRRSLYESFCLSFLTQLDYSSHPVVQNLIAKYICGKTELKALLSQPLPRPSSQNAVLVEGYWLPRGNTEPKSPEKYILTASVRRNLKDIARIVSAGKLPVLIQGETSVGKTSLVQYLADATGNTCYRINNHQHTDLQEYVGSYQSDENGKLVFTEGVLVQAMRRGEWIILDELNLAPSEVLEALNRLLDDNRQLFITETGVTVSAHPRFMLFATQNPPGLYGGRKLLSRAFRNRFVELHFDEIPTSELETILNLRCDIPVSYCKKIIGVLKELQTRRKSSAALQGKHSFATLRDLFRWAERYRQSGVQKTQFYDWDQHLADEGYLVLAGKARKAVETEVIREVLQKYLKRVVDPVNLFSLHDKTSSVTKDILELVLNADLPQFNHIVWTYPIRRLAVLIGSSMKFKEPVLLVGETGTGKTSVVQLLSHIYGRKLFSTNCHMHSESSDFLGGLRPVRNHDEMGEKLFEWVDGPLVEAMETGGIFLADEISLADDSVLERLNSVLEPERTLLIAEKGDETPKLIVANENFEFIGTMNPGGDFGKKELSPALRNRLTEIWCESTTRNEDLVKIIEHNLTSKLKDKGFSSVMIEMVEWLKNNEFANRCVVSIRDYLSWTSFVNYTTSNQRGGNMLDFPTSMEHGACLTFLDGLGMGNTASENISTTRSVRESALSYLHRLMGTHMSVNTLQTVNVQYVISDIELQLGPFTLKRNSSISRPSAVPSFTMESPTTSVNASRIFRALQLNKPILLEGSPGQGKTALVTALSKVAGFSLTRINLSEQTDISDLFGADLPVEGKDGGHFAWCDGPLLQALKNQSWILLDELNLASQSVLEGLNACLDHRGEIYVPELNRTFKIHGGNVANNSTRIFACQNPLRQGGARKGLPKSFLNRFTQVFIDALVIDDMKFIVHNYWSQLDNSTLDLMTSFSNKIYDAVCVKRQFGTKGGPWDFNLRDLMRWAELTWADYKKTNSAHKQLHPELYVDLIYGLRMRSSDDRKQVLEMFYNVWLETNPDLARGNVGVLQWGQNDIHIQDNRISCGRAEMERVENLNTRKEKLFILHKDLPVIEALIACLDMGWMPILVGSSGSGKTCLVKLLSQTCGQALEIICPSPEMDTTELLGGFEQADIYRKIDETCVDVCDLLLRFVKNTVVLCADWIEEERYHTRRIADVVGKSDSPTFAGLDWQLLNLWKNIKSLPHLTPDGTLGHAEEIKRIQNRVDFLQKAYLRCKSFFETQYRSNLKHEAGSYEYEEENKKDVYNNKKKGELKLEEVEEKLNNAKEATTAKQHLERVAGELEQIYTHLKAGIQTGSFQWIDSILIKALKSGNWLLIDGANRCSAAVLDRLNSLMEPDGSLVLSERGSLDGKIVEIKPHPNFRLILTMDPAYGEISRAMRNRGVEIFMQTYSSTMWDHAGANAMDVDKDNCSNVENDNVVKEVMAWTNGDVCPTLQSEFGISVFDLDALLRTEGLCNPRLRAAVLNLHREIHQAVASSSSPGVGLESRYSKIISNAKQIVLQMENGISYKDAMWAAFYSSFIEDDLIDTDRKEQIQEIIARFCQELDDTTFQNLSVKPLPIITATEFENSQAYRIWKNLQVIANALSETSWSQYESWRTKENKSLVENFVVVSVFSRVMKKDIRGLVLAVSKHYPLKSSFATKLASVLESSLRKSLLSPYNQGDIQGVPHLMVKFTDVGQAEQAEFLDSQLKICLRLCSENEIFYSQPVQILKKGTLGFVAKNVKKTDAGNLFEFLYGFWKIVTNYDNILDSCLSSSWYLSEQNHDELEAGVRIVARFSHVWVKGMKAVLWRKWMTELIQEDFDCKRPSEKLKSNIALIVQWIGEQVVPTLDAIRGINSSSQGNELNALVQKCLQPLDHCGNRMRLQRSASFRVFYGIRPFQPTDSLSIVSSTLSSCLQLWLANAPVDFKQIETLLMSCSNGNGAKFSHRIFHNVCRKLLKVSNSPLSLDEAQFIVHFKEKLEETRENRVVSDEDASDDIVSRMVMGIEIFLRLLHPQTSNLEYSVFVSPLLLALDGSNIEEYKALEFVLKWEEMERFKRTFLNNCPHPHAIMNACLLPYFVNSTLLDNHLIRSSSLGCRQKVAAQYATLNRHLSNEIVRPRLNWESTSGIIQSTCKSFLGLTRSWEKIFAEDKVITNTFNGWIEKLEKMETAGERLNLADMAELGCTMVEASCFMMEVAAYLPTVDPSVESQVLSKYLKDEIEYGVSWCVAQRLHGLYTTGHDIATDVATSCFSLPYLQQMIVSLEDAETRLHHAESNIAARPDPPEYEALRHEAMQFVRTMASKSRTSEMTTRVRNLFSNASLVTENEKHAVLVPCTSWLESCSNFLHKQIKRFWYWDISFSYIHPAILAITGFTLVCEAVQKSSISSRKMTTLSMLAFPNNHVSNISNASGIYEEPWAYKRATKKLLLSSVWNLLNKVNSYNCITPDLIGDLHEFSIEVARLWKEQQEEKAREKEMENALYIYKGREKKVESTEEEQEMENIASLFPDFVNDFNDLMEKSSLEFASISTAPDISSTSSNDVDILDIDDVSFFVKVHSLAVSFIRNQCLKADKGLDRNGKFDFITPFINQFQIGVYDFNNHYRDYGKDNEGDLIIGSNLVIKRLHMENFSHDKLEVYDIYRDSNVAEVVKLIPVLNCFHSKIQELLIEWPEHPALIQIIKVITRIESFDIKSPVVKFLTGVELLLTTAQEWESVAHKGVSIAFHLIEISNLVVSWRKLELNFWKNLLEINFIREQKIGKSWWFHLFDSAMEFCDGKIEFLKFLKVLQLFMESSPLGQFGTRLLLLEELHRHFSGLLQTFVYDDITKGTFTQLTSCTWNSLVYYKQFVQSVEARLKSLSTPIEKMIKDFIKISRWNDANFYALRDSIKKSQKTLNKLVTDYKKVLHVPVSTVLISNVEVDSQFVEKKKPKLTTKKLAYIMPEEWGKDGLVHELGNDYLTLSTRLSKLGRNYQTARSISTNVIVNGTDGYISQIMDTDELTGTIIEKVHELQNLPVPEQTGDKRKKALHHVHNLRRKNLAQLFKALQDLGLSFRRGMINLKSLDSETDFCDFNTEPADLAVGWKNLQSGNEHFPADLELIDAWTGCENYFQKCISRISVMLKSFHSPSKELGPHIIDRCKGYAIDLLQHVSQEKRIIGKYGKLLWELRLLTNQIHKPASHQIVCETVPDSYAGILYKGACEMELEYRQYELVADSLHDEYSAGKSSLNAISEAVISKISIVKSKLQETVGSIRVRGLCNGVVDRNTLISSISTFNEVLMIIESFHEKFELSSVLWNSLNKSKVKWQLWLQNVSAQIESAAAKEGKVDGESFYELVEKTLEALLMSFQRLDDGGKDESGNLGKFIDPLPVKQLLCFDLDAVVVNVIQMRRILNDSAGVELKKKIAIFSSLAPLILQFCFTAQFYLKLLTQHHRTSAKLLSVLSALFATLGQKGFCLPSDYEKDAVEEGQEMDEKAGMGLGEGETTSDAQDVSDRLESEDQLDDTMKAGESAQSADKDVGEDDKGVEMSEDFSGKQQDKKGKEDDENDTDDENETEDIDKEMGDVDGAEEKLNEKLWGGSSDEEDEDDNQDEGMEKGKGVPEKNESELASKNNDEKEGEENTNENESNSEPINKEFNEKDEDEELNDDQIDPYHGQNKPEEEPEAMELPDDLQLDDGDEKEEKSGEENPFDIDAADRELPEGLDESDKDEETGPPESSDQISDDEEDPSANDKINVEGQQFEENQENQDNLEPDEQQMDVSEEKAEEETKNNVETEDTSESGEKPEPSMLPTKSQQDNTPVNADSTKDKDNVPVPTEEDENPSKSDEQAAAGQVESKDGHGHEGKSVNKDSMKSSENKDDSESSRKPGETDSKRSLADDSNLQDRLKRLKTMDKNLNTDSGEGMEEDENKELEEAGAELYQHIESGDKKESLTVDNATREQLNQQKGMQIDEREKSEPKLDDTEEMEVDEEIEEVKETETDKNTPDLIRGLPENKRKPKNKAHSEESEEKVTEIEGERVLTYGVQRPDDSYSHTNHELLKGKDKTRDKVDIPEFDIFHQQVAVGSDGAALVEWHDLELRTLPLSQELCEQLRLILEPTLAARLKGDYKTGKRLNMRKVIPYIASGFRKDKIWLRRTQPSKREYQILLALDDSSSMLDNQSKQMAFSAVAVVARALSLLEAGKLAVGSFGEDFKLIHPFDEPFTDTSGSRIIQQFTFAQKRTRIAQLMQYSTSLFASSKSSSSSSIHPEVAQLMIIISDGRGINNEGVDVTKRAIMKAREQNIFIVFIIVDNPDNSNSILDIRQPVFGPNNSVEIVRYMDNFPFPFYLILRNIVALPSVLSDALRQWFELVTSSDR